MLENIVTVVHVLTCFFLILVVLLQSGKGGGVSAAFGGGGGAALGQRGAATVLGKLTGSAAALFMLTSMVLAVYSSPSANDPTKDFVESQGAVAPASAAETGAAAAGADKAPAEKAPAKEAPASKAE